jgi:hypothetical protein
MKLGFIIILCFIYILFSSIIVIALYIKHLPTDETSMEVHRFWIPRKHKRLSSNETSAEIGLYRFDYSPLRCDAVHTLSSSTMKMDPTDRTTRLHGITSQKIETFIFTVVTTSNLTQAVCTLKPITDVYKPDWRRRNREHWTKNFIYRPWAYMKIKYSRAKSGPLFSKPL